jgi:hypothetical protein
VVEIFGNALSMCHEAREVARALSLSQLAQRLRLVGGAARVRLDDLVINRAGRGGG